MATYTVPADTGLKFERGPSTPITLQWGTYFDAADQAGLSRIWGGIHPPVDDITGRRTGSQCGIGVWNLVQKYWDGSILNSPVNLTMKKLNASQCEVRYNTDRGMYYKVQAAPELTEPFVDVPGSTILATNSSWAINTNLSGAKIFFRVVKGLTP
ncbi:MAG TPA: hypothetical protein VMZ27_03385 [Candidatus Saccharimonadales bacterium]|nr:hypothetical protein [Candidatus Saccharimonadales bacterium]